MKKNELQIGKRYKLTETVANADGAVFEGDVVTLVGWTQVDEDSIICNVSDITDRRHFVHMSVLTVL
jgi:hypothetical protein